MAEPIPTGSDVSAGLPSCPSCNNTRWQTPAGGDSADDPYPDKS